MTIKSMTAFARADGAHGAVIWHWEVRSVNGRGLDLRLRLAPGYESLEPAAREAASKQLARGSVTATLSVQRDTAGVEIRLNEEALEQVLRAAERIQHLTGCERPRAEGLLALKGVLEVVERTEDELEQAAIAEAMLRSLEEALTGLVAARRSEGRRLMAVLAGQFAEIERLVAQVETSPARSPAVIAARLKDLVAKLMDSGQAFDPARLHQEAVLLSTRVDVEEEVVRLKAHIHAARDLLNEPGAVGRKLDFLAQEFNREANTLCSKSNDADITRAGLALKAVIDQMREQVQNIE